jgi:hypothetical protein
MSGPTPRQAVEMGPYLPNNPGPATGRGIGMLGVADATDVVESDTITARATR